MKLRGPLLFTLCVAVISAGFGSAEANPRRERASEFLARLSGYKSWKQVNRLDADVSTGTFKIENSSIFAGG